MKLSPNQIQILGHFQSKIKEQQELITASNVEVQKLKKEYSDVVTKIHENRLTQGVSITRKSRSSRPSASCTSSSGLRWSRGPRGRSRMKSRAGSTSSRTTCRASGLYMGKGGKDGGLQRLSFRKDKEKKIKELTNAIIEAKGKVKRISEECQYALSQVN